MFICRNKHTKHCHISFEMRVFYTFVPLENVYTNKNPKPNILNCCLYAYLSSFLVSPIHPSLCVYSHWDIKNVLVLFFFQSFYACVFFLRNFRFSTFDNISFFSQWECCCFWLHCMWNQIHLIRISISTKIPSDLLIYFANDWIQYANLFGEIVPGWTVRYCVILMYIGHLSCWQRR